MHGEEMTPEQQRRMKLELRAALRKARMPLNVFEKRARCLHAHPNMYYGGWWCPACGKRGKNLPARVFPERLHETAGVKMKFVVLKLWRMGMKVDQICLTLDATERQVRGILQRGKARKMRHVIRAVSQDELTALQNTFWVKR